MIALIIIVVYFIMLCYLNRFPRAPEVYIFNLTGCLHKTIILTQHSRVSSLCGRKEKNEAFNHIVTQHLISPHNVPAGSNIQVMRINKFNINVFDI